MSRFFSEKFRGLVPYTPGEQPRGRAFVKLNTNESPFPPSEKAMAAAAEAAGRLELYPDPACTFLRAALAETYGVTPDAVICTNGSDEVLNFAFMAFCDERHPVVFPDITYGFYEVFAALHRLPFRKIPLAEDFSIDPADYFGAGATIVLANPNAPTGLLLSAAAIEEIVASNPGHVVVIDEAYIDFGGESVVPLTKKYKNLLVTGTFSKSRSMAGARLGFGIGDPALIADLDILRCSTNPYNLNAMTMAAGLGVLADEDYTRRNCRRIIENRAYTAEAMKKLGFVLTDSAANFLFASHPAAGGGELCAALREKGILVRHFDSPRIAAYNRITIGSRGDCDALLCALAAILGRPVPTDNLSPKGTTP